MGELPLRGAALYEEGRGSNWGSSRYAGLLDLRRDEAAHGGAPATRGCLMGGWRRLQMGELPLRGAALYEEGRGSNWGSSRCAGLLDLRRDEAAHGGAPAARGYSISEGTRPQLGELPSRGAASWGDGRGCSWQGVSIGCGSFMGCEL